MKTEDIAHTPDLAPSECPPMSTIAVRFFAAAKAVAGADHVIWRTTSGETIDSLVRSNGFGEDPVFERCSFLLDGTVMHRNTPIGQAAELDVLPPFAGG